MAERILPRSSTSFSKVSATFTSTWSRNPPISPARTMDTYRRLKILGCLARAADSEVPFSTSARTWVMTSPRHGRRLLGRPPAEAVVVLGVVAALQALVVADVAAADEAARAGSR